MAKVARPITISEATKTGLRPSLSPRCPPMMPPRGRAANPTPRVAKDARVPATGLAPGKKAWPKYRAAAVPNPMKS